MRARFRRAGTSSSSRAAVSKKSLSLSSKRAILKRRGASSPASAGTRESGARRDEARRGSAEAAGRFRRARVHRVLPENRFAGAAAFFRRERFLPVFADVLGVRAAGVAETRIFYGNAAGRVARAAVQPVFPRRERSRPRAGRAAVSADAHRDFRRELRPSAPGAFVSRRGRFFRAEARPADFCSRGAVAAEDARAGRFGRAEAGDAARGARAVPARGNFVLGARTGRDELVCPHGRAFRRRVPARGFFLDFRRGSAGSARQVARRGTALPQGEIRRHVPRRVRAAARSRRAARRRARRAAGGSSGGFVVDGNPRESRRRENRRTPRLRAGGGFDYHSRKSSLPLWQQ